MLEGIWTALWTPTDQQGRLLVEPIKTHLDLLMRSGIKGVAVAGSTGQFPYLDVVTRQQLLDLVIGHIGAEHVMVNISAICPADVMALARHASRSAVAAVMLMPPFYYAFAQEDIAQYLIQMTNIANRPVVLYNFPESTRNRLELETVEAVAKAAHVIGIKQSGADYAYHTALVALGKKIGIAVTSGSDTRLDETLSLGVVGSISGIANAVPELLVEIYRSVHSGKGYACTVASNKISEVGKLLANVAFPLNIAALMEARQLVVGCTKEVVSKATQLRYTELVEALKSLQLFDCKTTQIR